jgi:hypothetical protein
MLLDTFALHKLETLSTFNEKQAFEPSMFAVKRTSKSMSKYFHCGHFLNLDSKTNTGVLLPGGTLGRNAAFCARWGMTIVVKRLRGTPFSTLLVSIYLFQMRRGYNNDN